MIFPSYSSSIFFPAFYSILKLMITFEKKYFISRLIKGIRKRQTFLEGRYCMNASNYH